MPPKCICIIQCMYPGSNITLTKIPLLVVIYAILFFYQLLFSVDSVCFCFLLGFLLLLFLFT